MVRNKELIYGTYLEAGTDIELFMLRAIRKVWYQKIILFFVLF